NSCRVVSRSPLLFLFDLANTTCTLWPVPYCVLLLALTELNTMWLKTLVIKMLAATTAAISMASWGSWKMVLYEGLQWQMKQWESEPLSQCFMMLSCSYVL
ncbi:hypothetical protein V8C86DRAFT_2728602, partial [Haematococcus lacustris]